MSVTRLALLAAAALLAPGPTGPDRIVLRPETGRLVLFLDDCTADQAAAVPVLARYQATATFACPSSLVGKPGYMTTADLRVALAYGDTVAAHGRSHRPMTTLPAERRAFEWQARSVLAADLGVPVDVWVYPDSDRSTETDREAVRFGYGRTFTGPGRRYLFGDGPVGYTVGRYDWEPASTTTLLRFVRRRVAGSGGTLVVYAHHLPALAVLLDTATRLGVRVEGIR